MLSVLACKQVALLFLCGTKMLGITNKKIVRKTKCWHIITLTYHKYFLFSSFFNFVFSCRKCVSVVICITGGYYYGMLTLAQVFRSCLSLSVSVFFRNKQRLHTAADMFLEVVLKRDFPEFITTYLNQDHTFLSSQNSGQVEAVDTDMPRNKLWGSSWKTASCSLLNTLYT